MPDPASGPAPPVILLFEPQLGENIGAAARVMLNFALTDLRIISPRDGWPNAKADAMAAGALEAGVAVSLFDSLEAACADLSLLLAATARPREMDKPVLDAAGAVARLRALESGTGHRVGDTGPRAGVLFGGEKSGLPNGALALCEAILTYPVNPDFASLNLAQAVGVFCHAWGAGAQLTGRFGADAWASSAQGYTPGATAMDGASVGAGVGPPASRGELIGMFEHFEDELQRAGFFFPPEKTELMKINLRNAIVRAGWTAQEVRTFRGAVKALALGRGAHRVVRDE